MERMLRAFSEEIEELGKLLCAGTPTTLPLVNHLLT